MSQINVDVVAPQSGNDVTVNGAKIRYNTAARQLRIGNNNSNVVMSDTIAIGNSALQNGAFNNNGPAVAIGSEALKNTVAPGSNVAIGYRSLLNADGSTGINNVAVGVLSGSSIVDGGNNTVIGHWAGIDIIDGVNNIVIGSNATMATPSDSNSITLGDNQINVFRCNVQTITSLSDARDKKDVKELGAGLDFVKGLKPVEFVWDERGEDGKKDIKDFGFIAQDLKKSQEDANLADTLKLVYEENPEKLEASYGKLVPILVKAIQELTAKVEALEAK